MSNDDKNYNCKQRQRPILLQKRLRGVDVATIDVNEICPDRPLPACVKEKLQRNRKCIRKIFSKRNETENQSLTEKVTLKNEIQSTGIYDPLFLRIDQSHLPPLERFDLEGAHDPSPQSWVASGSPAFAVRFTNRGNWVWDSVSVGDFDKALNKYQVTFEDSRETKLVSRLNLLFEQEEKEAWMSRRSAAFSARESYKQYKRFTYFVTNQHSAEIEGLPEDQLKNIIRKASAFIIDKFVDTRNVVDDDDSTYRNLIHEVESRYALSMKCSYVMNRFLVGYDDYTRYKQLKLPDPSKLFQTNLSRTLSRIEVSDMNIFNRRMAIQHSHPFLRKDVYKVFLWLNDKWLREFSHVTLLDSHFCNHDYPCPVKDFVQYQMNYCRRMTKTLENEWRISFAQQFMDGLDQSHDFFQSSFPAFQKTYLAQQLKLGDLFMAQQLRECCYRTISSFFDLFQGFSDQESSHPLFTIPLCLKDDTLQFQTSEEEIESQLYSIIDYCLSSVHSFESIDSVVMSLLRLTSHPLIDNQIVNDSFEILVLECKETVTSVIRHSFKLANNVMKLFHKFSDIRTLEDEPNLLLGGLEGSQPFSYNLLSKKYELMLPKLQYFHQLENQIRSSSLNFVDCGAIRIETTEVKMNFCAKVNKARDKFLSIILNDLEQAAVEITSEYDDMIEKIQLIPSDEKNYAWLLAYTNKSRMRVTTLLQETNILLTRFEDMEQYSSVISCPYSIWHLLTNPSKVNKAIDKVAFKLTFEKERLVVELNRDKDEFVEFLSKFEVALGEVQKLIDYDAMEINCEKVNDLMYSFTKATSLAENFLDREITLGLEPSSYPMLSQYREGLMPFSVLWNMVIEFRLSREEWLNGPLLQLDSSIIEDNMEGWWKSSRDISKIFKELQSEAHSCVLKLQNELSSFGENLSLLKSVASKALKERHWEKISELINSEIELDDDLTFNYLLDLGILQKYESIEVVCFEAEKEFTLEKKLNSMIVEWNVVNMIVKPHRETGTYVVGGIDEIITLLDDQFVKVQAIRGSPYIKPLEKKCHDWESKLKYAQDLIDEIIRCQKNWMYLEPIFTSDDINVQLPTESKRFQGVDSLWRKVMKEFCALPTFMLHAEEERGLYEQFSSCNIKLDEIQKGLSEYLESKRLHFPRFYFLSDDELIEILSKTKDPNAVQPHLHKCFEGINKIDILDGSKIERIYSSEGECIHLVTKINTDSDENKGKVEKWLLELQYVHWDSIYILLKKSLQDYLENHRKEWVLKWPAQVVLAVSQIFWTEGQEQVLQDRATPALLKDYVETQNQQMRDLVMLVRGKVSKLDRRTLGALMTIDVHARDVSARLAHEGTQSITDFGWISQVRYCWEKCTKNGQAVSIGDDTVLVKVINAKILYGYEYLGNSSRLVITPLTDRCYRTMLGAIDLLLGGAPEGPAGTGKTETVKDLSKAIAIQCVVFNCSDGLDYVAMAKFFKGVSACGAWCCFDEFNRINIEVLSVIAQQILTITQAKREGLVMFQFSGSTLPLNHNANVFITMNPGYAGRADLPDNLKALFRPCSMMVPDYALISEIRLYSFGFEDARSCARKLVKTLQLCSEQCSNQKHYDYGMRAVNSILVAAGNLREKLGESNEWNETSIVLRAINDVNRAKFTVQDLPLFEGITNDLFPGISLPKSNYDILERAIQECCEQGIKLSSGETVKFQLSQCFYRKIIELYEMICVRHGICVVGETCSGKSTSINLLAESMTLCSHREQEHMKTTKVFRINPKAISIGELYGTFDDNTHEWNDGILAIIYRNAAKDSSPKRNWILFDGPIDAVWIENMNTVLDDNKKLCLSSGEIIKMSELMTMMFETDDLEQASPATVSRLGIVYTESKNLGWCALWETWLECLSIKFVLFSGASGRKTNIYLSTLMKWLFPPAMFFIDNYCSKLIPISAMECCSSLSRLLDSFFKTISTDITESNKIVEGLFLMALIWSLGAAVDQQGRNIFSDFITILVRNDENLCSSKEYSNFLLKSPSYLSSLPDEFLIQASIFVEIKQGETFFDYYFDVKTLRWMLWETQDLTMNITEKCTSLHNLLVPTIDAARNGYIVSTLMKNNCNVIVTGETGTGKSVGMKNILHSALDKSVFSSIIMSFTARTKSSQVQETIESKLFKRRKGVIGPDIGCRKIIFIDDLNMPAKEKYGAQPPIELLRQWMDYSGWYCCKENVFKFLVDIQFSGAMGLPGGGRTQITQRFMRHFNIVAYVAFGDDTLKHIFGTVTRFILSRGFNDDVKLVGSIVVETSIDIYRKISRQFLPTPSKSHYTFNLRDLSKVFLGLSRGQPESISNKAQFIELFVHEVYRVFHDRLVCYEDQACFDKIISERITTAFNDNYTSIDKNILFGDFRQDKTACSLKYEKACNMDSVKKFMMAQLNDYNSISLTSMSLVMFDYAVIHVARIARIINISRGHALLVGVGSLGRKSLCTLAAHMTGYQLFRIEIGISYRILDWREDLKRLFKLVGIKGKPIVFLVDDSQIFDEAILEDISSILNTGEVANLFSSDERISIIDSLANEAKAIGIDQTAPLAIYTYFLKRCREGIRIVFTASPIGGQFRSRLRLFPALINCCTINWFMPWPEDALSSVAESFLNDIDLPCDTKIRVVQCCVGMLEDSRSMASKYFEELGRTTHITPTSYLILINIFRTLLDKQRLNVEERKARYDNGLAKIKDTQIQVDKMRKSLVELRPKLDEATISTDKLLDKIATDTKTANKSRAVLEKEEAFCNERTAEASSLASDCEADLAKAMPALDAAVKALKTLSKGDIVEVKSMKNPPEAVKMVMTGVCILMDISPGLIKDANSGKKIKDYWSKAQKVLLGDSHFLQNLVNYDKESMCDDMIEKVKEFTSNPEFDPKIVKKSSVAASGLCKWVHAMVIYYEISKEVGPKKMALIEAQEQVYRAQELLSGKQAELKILLDQLVALKSSLDIAEAKKSDLERQVSDCRCKLERAEQLISGLGSEQERWLSLSNTLGSLFNNITGDILLSSGSIALLGPFTASYRQSILQSWSQILQSKNIACSSNFSLSSTLGDPVIIREWIINKLPNDSLSINNAIMLNQSHLWPLMIDPQQQASKWIKKTELVNKLKIVKLSQTSFVRTLENAIQFGMPVLIENVGETLDPILDPLLLKQLSISNGISTIRLSDNIIEYDFKFRLYISSSLSNPCYSPEICAKVNILNFMSTPDGLEDQFLGTLVAIEEPKLELQREEIVLEDAENKYQLQKVENQILLLLQTSQGNILDDEILIDKLNQSKATSDTIQEKVHMAAKTKTLINDTRRSYQPVAYQASTLFFCLTELCEIDPMYQFSLDWFSNLFELGISLAEKSNDLRKRLQNLNETILFLLYSNVCKSLFAKDKLLFSVMLCTRILMNKKVIHPSDLSFFLQGSSDLDLSKPKPLSCEWIPDKCWKDLVALCNCDPVFNDIDIMISSNKKVWLPILGASTPLDEIKQATGGMFCTFHEMMILRCLRLDAVVPSLKSFVEETLGRKYIEVPPFNLRESFKDSKCTSPIIFVLTPGSDPVSPLMELAKVLKVAENVTTISMGQGQGPIAEQAIKDGMRKGKWIFLQNCHLCVSWMPVLVRICEDLSQNFQDVNEHFRLWLSSEPSPLFPSSILQNGIKITVEPAQGLRSNLKSSYLSMDPDFFEANNNSSTLKKLAFALCFFHATIRERKKYGSLGWNNSYVFSIPDLTISMNQLRIFLNESKSDIPYEALHYLTAECNYGGRVTDDKDRRLLANILDDFYRDDIMSDSFTFSPSGIYYAPKEGSLDTYLSYIENLPLNDPPEIFGLHDNANITCALHEANSLLSSLLSLRPKRLSNNSRSWADQVEDIALDVEARLPPLFDMEIAELEFPARYEQSMNTVLTQELRRYNNLLSIIKQSLSTLRQAIKGKIEMSFEIEEMGHSIVLSQVPKVWKAISYPSLKPLSSWVNDLLERVAFFSSWLQKRQNPSIYWIGGFYVTQAFITGTLQNFARKYNISIDKIGFDFHVLTPSEAELATENPPSDGSLIQGLFLDGACWDLSNNILTESKPRELFTEFPFIHLIPKPKVDIPIVKGSPRLYTGYSDGTANVYECPVYRTSERSGTLTTTGHSSNFVMYINLPINPVYDQKHWIKRGVALITQLDD